MGDPLQEYEVADLPRDAAVTVKTAGRAGRRVEGRPWAGAPPRPPPERSHAPIAAGLRADRREAEARALSTPDVIFTSFRRGRRWAVVVDPVERSPRRRGRPRRGRRIAKDRRRRRSSRPSTPSWPRASATSNVSFGIGRMQPRPAPDVLSAGTATARTKTRCWQRSRPRSASSAAGARKLRPGGAARGRAVPATVRPHDRVARLSEEPKAGSGWTRPTSWGPPGYLRRPSGTSPPCWSNRMAAARSCARPRIRRSRTGPTSKERGRSRRRACCVCTSVEVLRPGDSPLRGLSASAPREQHAAAAKSLSGHWKDGKMTNVTSRARGRLDAVPGGIRHRHTVRGRAKEKEWALWIPFPPLQLPEAREGRPQARRRRPVLAVNEFRRGRTSRSRKGRPARAAVGVPGTSASAASVSLFRGRRRLSWSGG